MHQNLKKLALIRILQIFKEHSDYDHPLTQEDIAAFLEQDYGIVIERKAIGRNILLLKEAGYQIESGRNGSYLDEREFEDSELHMLIDDAIERGRQIKFDYNKYGVDKKLHRTTTHRASPYQLVLHNQRYYLMSLNERWHNIDDSVSLVVNFNLLSTFSATLIGNAYQNLTLHIIHYPIGQFWTIIS